VIPLFKVFLPPEDELIPALREILYSGQISIGEPVAEFERAFARTFGLERALAISSGTAGLHLSLALAGVGPGDEVVSTAMTAEPTNTAIAQTGARVVWADVDPRNGLVTADTVRAALSPRTRAIMVVDYGGIPVELEALAGLARELDVPLIEDAAHALGARYDGRPVGTHADYVVFSLQAIKHMTTVDGGMLVCRREADHERARLLRWFGIDRSVSRAEADIREVGFKYNMNNVTATIGLVALRHIEGAIARHVENGRFLDEALADAPGVRSCAFDERAEPSYWFYTVLADRRDELAEYLHANGVAADVVHTRNDRHSLFADSRRALPDLDAFAARYLHVPCGWWVDDEARGRIAGLLHDWR
jgi:dTDP-4-amino-4,6-dideoxygalactose transaminase